MTALAVTGLISMVISSIMITNSKKIYQFVSPVVSFFEHSKGEERQKRFKAEPMVDHVVLIGAHRLGGAIANFLKTEDIPLVVLDFNPKVVSDLDKKGINAFYGDIADPETHELLSLQSAKIIISTAQDLNDSLILLALAKRHRLSAVVIVRAPSAEDAKRLYKAGADFVILPEIIAGDYLLQTLKDHWPSVDFFKDRSQLELTKLSRNHLATN